MGSTANGEDGIEPKSLFEGVDLGRRPGKVSHKLEGANLPATWRSPPPLQTNDKSRLIADYIANFQRVTRGGLYIDGFAAPQSRQHEEAWTARRVLEVRPARIRTFWLCDVDPGGLGQLRKLKSLHHAPKKQRRVFVMEGDFNKTVKTILKSTRLTRRAAIFALLDQRNTECHWATVRALAARAGRHKIELMYFFGASWMHRSLGTSKDPKRLNEIEKWWGNSSWRSLLDLTQAEAAQKFSQRFEEELRYKHVNYYPLFGDRADKKPAFFLIHASDHPEAPKLMARSYVKVIGDVSGTPADTQTSWL